MSKIIPPLSSNVEIVTKDGKPTSYFSRLLQKVTAARLDGTNTFVGTQTIQSALDINNGSGSEVYLSAGDATYTGEVYLRNNTGSAYLDLFGSAAGFLYSANANHQFQIGNVTKMTVSTTGCAVVGVLSATGNITGLNLSGTNTGDETSSTILTKIGATGGTTFLRKDGTWAAAGGGGGGYEGTGNLLSLAGLTKLSGASANLTLTDGTKAHRYVWSASGANTVQMAYTSAPGTPWDIYLRHIPEFAYGVNVQFGLAIRNSTSAKITIFTFNGSALIVQEWTNATTFSSTQVNLTVPVHPFYWFRINNDGTNLNFYRSLNGVDWVLIGTRTLAAFMSSVDQVGIGGVPQSASSALVSNFGFTTPS